jgi:hypothetical protein
MTKLRTPLATDRISLLDSPLECIILCGKKREVLRINRNRTKVPAAS